MSPAFIHLLSAVVAAMVFLFFGPDCLAPKPYNAWPGLSFMAFGSMVFLFAYSAIYKSISLRLLVEGAKAYPHAVSIERLHNETVLPRFIDRINLLADSGHIRKDWGFLVITARGRKLYSALVNLRTLLGFTASGLYYTSKKARKS